jgi:hypothetical protein
MPRYRVTLQRPSVEIIEAENPYMAAILAAGRYGDGVQVADVRPALGRAAATKKNAPAKKKRTLSPQARAKLAKNLEKARAARARNLRATKRTATKKTTKAKATKKR